MISRVLFAIVVAATFGLSACEKSQEPAAEQTAPATGAVEQGTSAAERAAETEGSEKTSE